MKKETILDKIKKLEKEVKIFKIEKLERKINALKKEVEGKVEDKKPCRFKPEVGQRYFVTTSQGSHNICWQDDIIDKNNYEFDNCFKTKKEAELAILRLKSMAQRGELPEEGEYLYYWSFNSGETNYVSFSKVFILDWWAGAIHKTKEASEKWYKKYGKAWEVK